RSLPRHRRAEWRRRKQGKTRRRPSQVLELRDVAVRADLRRKQDHTMSDEEKVQTSPDGETHNEVPVEGPGLVALGAYHQRTTQCGTVLRHQHEGFLTCLHSSATSSMSS